MNKDILALRNKINRKRPAFLKQGTHKKKRLEKKWKFPRGSDSKIAIERKGYPKRVKMGYRGPALARGLSKTGFNIVLVSNIADLGKVDKTKDIVCIAHVGTRKKVDIAKECLKQNLKILNLKDAPKFLSEVEQVMKENKEEKAKKAEDQKKKSDDSKKEKPKEGIEGKVDKEEDKKEKDKLLTKREIWN